MKQELNQSKKLILLDCTFRDGGYYNNWHFHENLVNEYLLAMSNSFISHVELGFRFKSKNGFNGPTAYTSDDFLRRLVIPKNLKIGVMINASDLIDNCSLENIINKLFPENKKTSRIDFVRIASHYKELDLAFEASVLLNNLGFKVGLNLMQISERTEKEINMFIDKSKNYPIDVLYCADSVGGLNNKDVKNIFEIFKVNCNHIPFGFHAHDNLNLALSNTLCAIDNGATWVDSTMSGMGRGPGNTKTEELVLELASLFNSSFDLTLLFDLVYTRFYQLKKHYQWGANIFYYISGKRGIHPSYVQTMMSDSSFSSFDILTLLEFLKNKPLRSTFDRKLLFNQNNLVNISSTENWCPKEIFLNRDVLIIGNGKSIVDHSIAISDYITKYKPIVIALNYVTEFPNIQIDVRLSSHPLRIHSNINQYINEKNILIIPFSYLDERELELINRNKNIKNFSFSFTDSKFDLDNENCKIPSNLTLAYALAVVVKGNCNNIFLAGIDGYETGDGRNNILESIFEAFYYSFPKIEITSLTETKIRNLKVKSVYGF